MIKGNSISKGFKRFTLQGIHKNEQEKRYRRNEEIAKTDCSAGNACSASPQEATLRAEAISLSLRKLLLDHSITSFFYDL